MKKLFPLLSFVVTALAQSQAQHIPDAFFANRIRQECPACIDANNDLTLVAQTLTRLDVNRDSIADLTGISGFTMLDTFICSFNQITALPTLPPNLRYLDCATTHLTSMAALPNTLEYLDCSSVDMTTCPTLPPSLQHLICKGTNFTALPALSSLPLTHLNCYGNTFTNLPALPTSLIYLNCYHNQLVSLPTFFCNPTNRRS